MGLGSERDLVPLGAGFDIVKRGYSRTQVEEHLERLDSDLRLIAADRDASVSQTADLARQLERARSELDDLRGQVARLSLPPTTLEGLSERLQRMLRLAQEEASDTKARAESDAGQIRARSEADAAALRNRYEKLIAEVDGRRVELETEHRELVEKSTAELAAREKKAEQDRHRADSEAEARRSQIDDDFEIAMADRRTKAMKALAAQEATSKAEAERRVREATDEAAKLRAKVAEEQRVGNLKIAEEQRISTETAERRLREAAEEALRVRNQIAEEQRASKADTERRLREATEEANRRRHEALTESKARLQDAADESNRRVREATDEANRRIGQAAGRVEALRTLRAQIAEQLRSAHTLITNATPVLEPLPEEHDGSSGPGATTPVGHTAASDGKAATAAGKPAGRVGNPGGQVGQGGVPGGHAGVPDGTWPIEDAGPAEATAEMDGAKTAANATTKRTAPVQPPAGQGNRPNAPGAPGGAVPSPNRPAQGVRRAPSAKR